MHKVVHEVVSESSAHFRPFCLASSTQGCLLGLILTDVDIKKVTTCKKNYDLLIELIWRFFSQCAALFQHRVRERLLDSCFNY